MKAKQKTKFKLITIMTPSLFLYSLSTIFVFTYAYIDPDYANVQVPEVEINSCSNGEETIDYILIPASNRVVFEQTVLTTNANIYIETLVIVDEAMLETVGKQYSNGGWMKPGTLPNVTPQDKKMELTIYLRKFVTAVNSRFQNQISNPKIKLQIAGLKVGNPSLFAKSTNGLDFRDTLENFKFETYQRLYKNAKFDIAMVLSAERFEEVKGATKVLGLAITKGVCTVDKNIRQYMGVMITKDVGGAFAGVETAVHELGHLLGAPHDGYGNDCCSDDGYIMRSPKKSAEAFPVGRTHLWSNCSIKAMKSFLRSSGAYCLKKKPKKSLHPLFDFDGLVHPNVPTPSQQCNSFLADYYTTPSTCGDRPCQFLECFDKTKCQSQHFAMEGSLCSSDGQVESVCRMGKCLPRKYGWWAQIGPSFQ